MEEELKQLLGENYHEGMTAQEVQQYFQKSVLESGNYVNKQMAEAEKTRLENQLKEKEEALQAKLTDEEKSALAQAARDKELQELKELLAKNTLSANNYKAFGLTAEARINAGIKDDDKEFTEFLKGIVNDDEQKTTEMSSYINKLVKAAYEKGKADITKNKMANMGNFNKNENNDGDGEKGSFGAQLAKQTIGAKKQNNSYFQI